MGDRSSPYAVALAEALPGNGGSFRGRDPRNIVQEAIDWWQQQINAMEADAAQLQFEDRALDDLIKLGGDMPPRSREVLARALRRVIAKMQKRLDRLVETSGRKGADV